MLTGPQRIQAAIDAARAERRAALLVCLPSDQPTSWLVAAARACTAAGADLLEVQVRYPRHPAEVVEALGAVAREAPAPCLLWTDMRVVRDFAITEAQPWRLVAACVEAGVAGLAAPVPRAHAEVFARACGDHLAHIPFVSPQQTPEALAEICGNGPAFVYAIGVTTSPPTDPGVFDEVADFLDAVRAASGTPVFIGAGVGTPAQAALAATFADGVAVAKAAFQTLEGAAREGRDPIAALASLVGDLRHAVERRQD